YVIVFPFFGELSGFFHDNCRTLFHKSQALINPFLQIFLYFRPKAHWFLLIRQVIGDGSYVIGKDLLAITLNPLPITYHLFFNLPAYSEYVKLLHMEFPIF